MRALIDGDMAVHMACAAQQITGDLGDGLGETDFFDVEEAVHGAAKVIRNWTKAAGARGEIVCFSGDNNFRKVIFPEYKANRTGEKPHAYKDVKEAIEVEYETWEIDGLEADDIMGIAGSRDPGNFVIVSRDKDMMTIPGTVFNPDVHKKPVKVRKAIADQMWMKQTMVGDSVDNYKGIPKIGEKTAQELILDPRRLDRQPTEYFQKGPRKGQKKPTKYKLGPRVGLWEAMVSHAAAKGMTERDLILQARVARILRTGEFNTDTRTVSLWHPGGKPEELHLG